MALSLLYEQKVLTFLLFPAPFSQGHPASETEYERMNSDVRSDESSSGTDDEQSAFRERSTNIQRSEKGGVELPSITNSSGAPKVNQQLTVRTGGLPEDPAGGGSLTPSPSHASALLKTTGSGELRSGGGSISIEDQTRSAAGSTEIADAPFALWYFHTIQVSRWKTFKLIVHYSNWL